MGNGKGGRGGGVIYNLRLLVPFFPPPPLSQFFFPKRRNPLKYNRNHREIGLSQDSCNPLKNIRNHREFALFPPFPDGFKIPPPVRFTIT